ncbi:MAG TPA: TRZ/ATZ family hydrolase [Candidatus Binatia bacterium]|nr:TRZ/ATZ family hydrolase [Candidatus Binatia bacterium]
MEGKLLSARWVVPVEPAGAVLEDHAVAVRDGVIEQVLPAPEAAERFADYEQVSLPDHVLIPGLVNAHTHAAMALMRGLGDDLPLERWLSERMWPVERRHLSARLVRDGTALACAEMLRGGVTCFNDMYFFPEAALEAALEAQMRVAVGLIVVDFATPYASDPDDYLRKGLALRDASREQPLASFCFAPHAPYTVSDDALRHVATLAAELDIPVHLHLHETEGEIERSLAEHGVRPLERLRRLGLLGPGLIAVHGVHLLPDEIEILARHGCSVVHCPSSNLKLASGIARVAEMLDLGVSVSLGADGAPCNNRLDMFTEMRAAALLQKVLRGSRALPALTALRMATTAGARALGLADRIGGVEAGKRADLQLINLDRLHTTPRSDPISTIVYAAEASDVETVIIDGKIVMRDGDLITLKEHDVIADARDQSQQLCLRTSASN